MTKISALALGGLLAFSTVALAHADGTMTGTWKLSVGANAAPCTLTLSSDEAASAAGTVVQGADCDAGLSTIGHWKSIGSGLQLYSPSGDLVALLKAKGASYQGSRVSDGRKVALDR
jgi:hypothetical protein